jgi:hypothetical protein
MLDAADPHDNLPEGHKFVTDPMNQQDHTPLNDAYLQLEVDISNNADKQTIKTDAQQVQQLAGSDHPGLADAANNISKIIDDGSLTALMNNPSNAAAAPPPSSPPPASSPPPHESADETTPYQKLLADIQSGADRSTLINDVEALFAAAIHNGDFGLSQAALDIGETVKAGPFDKSTATKTLTDAAPGTSGAQLPPTGGWDWAPPPPNAPAT